MEHKYIYLVIQKKDGKDKIEIAFDNDIKAKAYISSQRNSVEYDVVSFPVF